MATTDQLHALTRRAFLGGAAATAFAVAEGARWPQTAHAAGRPQLADGVWLGPELWGNRLQDWVRNNGRLECTAPSGQRRTRTITWLTREITGPDVHLSVRTGELIAAAGLSGFVIGTGVPGEDWRRRALVGSASGTGGGLLAVYQGDGKIHFRDHTDETDQFAWTEIPSTALVTGGPLRHIDEDVTLNLDITPSADGTAQITLTAVDTATGTTLAQGQLDGVELDQIRGGIHLVSSALNGSGSLFWLSDPTGWGRGLAFHPERAIGPVLGTLFSVSGSTLKLSAQLMPVNTDAIGGAKLQVATPFGWRTVASEPVGAGYTVLFRVDSWDSRLEQRYRVLTPDGSTYEGLIPREPAGSLSIAMINCTKAASRRLDAASAATDPLPGSHLLGLYSERNLWFPHEQLATNVAEQSPDLIVALGDQLYENSPTVEDPSKNPELDWLYKYYLWLWAFRDLTRRLPTIVLVDDHDVYQGNIWGDGGVADPTTNVNDGGYVNDPTWVNTIQRASCAHDPDPFDPTPVAQGISVYYCAFSYGGVSFAVVEDRKFKSPPTGLTPDGQPIPTDQLALLGDRQEAFLATWPQLSRDQPRILLTQTAWACVQTTATGGSVADQDTGGWPKPARDRAVTLVKQAGALMLSGDQHLGSLIHHGIDEFTDGPIQFTTPAGSTDFQRWFEPATTLPNAGSSPNTGDWTDGFGNQFRALGLVNPSFTQAEFRTVHPGPNDDNYGDRALKNEGYGIVRVDHFRRQVTLECWRFDTPVWTRRQFPGFPQIYGFDEL